LNLLELWTNEQREEGRQTKRQDKRAEKKLKKSQGLSRLGRGRG